MSVMCHHRWLKAQSVVIYGQLLGGQPCTHPLILPDVNADSPTATFCDSFNLAGTKDTSFIDVCKHAVNAEIAVLEAEKHQELNNTLQAMPDKFKGINIRGLKLIIDKSTLVHAIRCCGTNGLDIHAMNTCVTHTSMSLVSLRSIVKPLCLINVPHVFRQNRQRFLQDHI